MSWLLAVDPSLNTYIPSISHNSPAGKTRAESDEQRGSARPLRLWEIEGTQSNTTALFLKELMEQSTHATQFESLPLMDERPPVPPKDLKYTPRMDTEQRPVSAPASGSKRKREVPDDDIYSSHDEDFDAINSREHTPKRSRPSLRQSNSTAFEDSTPARQRNVRRKKASSNLSYLNLRHAAKQQSPETLRTRESKFQEGSLTDKPSEKPPSVFTKISRTESEHSIQVEELMTDYNNGMPTPRDSAELAKTREKTTVSQSGLRNSIEPSKKDEGKGFFQFGRQWAANFHPVALWQKLWNETKDELTQKQIEEAEKNARKAQAEAKYAEMKRNGQMGLKRVGVLANGTTSSSDEVETPHDSVMAIDDLQPPVVQNRSMSSASGLAPPADDATSRSGSDIPDTASKQNKGLKSRLHLKKPSLTNIKSDLKRVKSDFNLAAAIGNRDSSASLSPVKMDFDSSTLRKSHSKYDLKKQNKLSKRVSDLETKLEQARKELDEALVEASPMPKLSGRFERFTPTTIKRPKFIPGKLPSLPSERILLAQESEREGLAADYEHAREPRKPVDLSKMFDDDEMDEEDTIKARARPYPTRASSLLNLDKDEGEDIPPIDNKDTTNNIDGVSEQVQPSTEATSDMDPNSINNFTSEGAIEPVKQADYSSLDAKLKALDANVKTARRAKAPKSKKRKSGMDDDDKLFKPVSESDDDAEWKEATPRKKRKSTGDMNESSPPSKRTPNGKRGSPQNKKANGSATKVTSLSSSPANKKVKAGEVEQKQQQEEEAETQPGAEEFSADELANNDIEAARMSVESQAGPLDIVYEEEEETFTVPLNDEPSKPTAKATPARYGRTTTHSRPTSPHKRAGSVHADVEEQMITRAAEAAQKHPARNNGRSVSPPPSNGYTKTKVTTETEIVTVVPGKNGAPRLPKGANGSFESLIEEDEESTHVDFERSRKSNHSFEWPEDVF